MDTQTVISTRTEEWTRRRHAAIGRAAASATPIIVERAHGAEIWDVDGRRYIDFAGGIGTLNAGHTPDAVVQAIQEQAAALTHTCFAVAQYPPYIEVAERVAAIAPGDFPKKTLLFNSGAEAVENAVKIARVATGRTGIIAFENAFHGRTNMAMALTGKERPYREGFGPFAPDIYHAQFPYRYRCACSGRHEECPIETGRDLERLFATAISPRNVAAIIVEPVQGEGGFIVAPPEWLRLLRRICDREGILLIADEIQTGFGRTGSMFAMEQAGVVPDLTVMAKSLAGGLPLSAVAGRAEIMDAPGPGTLGGTYAGNPVACVAALAVLDLYEREEIVARGKYVGEIVEARFASMAERYSLIGEARGLGAMRAIELVADRRSKEPAKAQTAEILSLCHSRGLIVLKAGLYDNVIRVLMPLTIDHDLLAEGLDILEDAVAEVAVRV